MTAESDAAFEETWECIERRNLRSYPGYLGIREIDKDYIKEVAKAFWLDGRIYQEEKRNREA